MVEQEPEPDIVEVIQRRFTLTWRHVAAIAGLASALSAFGTSMIQRIAHDTRQDDRLEILETTVQRVVAAQDLNTQARIAQTVILEHNAQALDEIRSEQKELATQIAAHDRHARAEATARHP